MERKAKSVTMNPQAPASKRVHAIEKPGGGYMVATGPRKYEGKLEPGSPGAKVVDALRSAGPGKVKR